MKNVPDQIPGRCRVLVGRPEFLAACRSAGIEGALALTDRDRGVVVTDHRSSWVRRCEIGSREVFVKTYDYPLRADRRRGAFRTTFWAASRAKREAEALQWLAAHGFPAPEPLLAAEWRRLGWLRRALLVTSAWPGMPLDRWAEQLDEAGRERLGRAATEFVTALHRAGFRDGNLDTRNLLARSRDAAFELTVIDSPRFRLRPAGPADDRLARADWERLAPQLKALRIPLPQTPRSESVGGGPS